jgi:hypothetical protein
LTSELLRMLETPTLADWLRVETTLANPLGVAWPVPLLLSLLKR